MEEELDRKTSLYISLYLFGLGSPSFALHSSPFIAKKEEGGGKVAMCCIPIGGGQW
jgi:hypothetical protein